MIAHSPKDIFNHLTGRKGFDYDQIEEGVFIGTNMCCQFGFDKELLSKGVRADISLEELKIDTPTGVDYFLWLPTKDHHALTEDKMALGVQALEFFIRKKIKVYIHCQNGHGRAPTLFAAYLIKSGMSVEKAIEYLKSRRPSIHINENQMAALRKMSAQG